MKNQNLHPNEQKEIKRLEIEDKSKTLNKARGINGRFSLLGIITVFVGIMILIWGESNLAFKVGLTGVVIIGAAYVMYSAIMRVLVDLEHEMDKLINSDER